MDPLAWTSYAAVTLLAGAIGAGVDLAPDPLADFLLGGAFDLGKGEPLSFDPTTRQLLQPLYIARSAGEAEWGPNLGQRVAVAELAGTVPAPRADPATCRPGTQALLIQDD